MLSDTPTEFIGKETGMLVSAKGRYALRVMAELAAHDSAEYIPLKDMSDRQGISRKFLESIMTSLAKSGLVDSVSGKNGGYRLCRPPEKYNVGEILEAVEGTLEPAACTGEDEKKCVRTDMCCTFRFWKQLSEHINSFLFSYTLDELINGTDCKTEIIKENNNDGQ